MTAVATIPMPIAEPHGRPTEAFAESVMSLHVPGYPDRYCVERSGAALQVHQPLAQVARCRGALDVAVGDRLAALTEGDRVLRLGFVSLSDYARERLQISPRRAQALARLSRELESRPQLDQAVRQGLLSARKAQVVLPVAQGEDEARWLKLALDGTVTVRALEKLVKAEAAETDETAEPAPEPFRSLRVELSDEQNQVLDLALAVAGQVLGPGARKWERIQAICQEYLGSFPTEREETLVERESDPERSVRIFEAVEQTYHYWQLLDELAPTERAGARERPEQTDPFELDRELVELGRARAGWDELVGRLGLLMRTLGLWRDMGFASFGHYCREQLGMSQSALLQRARLEERLYALPELREALRQGHIGYECARLIAQVAREKTIERWLEWARGRTVLAVRQAVERYAEAPLNRRERMAPWDGPQRCVAERAPRMAELLRPSTAEAAGQLTTTDVPVCTAGLGPMQMCAPGEPDARATQMCSPDWGPPCCLEPGPGPRLPYGGGRLRVPKSVLELLWVAISEVRLRTGRWLEAGECIEVLAAHFVVVWFKNLDSKKRKTLSQRIVERDRGQCSVPGCSRRAEQAHHVKYRSRGGGDEESNLTAECAAHHLAAEHQGFIEVSGRAPDELSWKLGVRAGKAPLLTFEAGRWGQSAFLSAAAPVPQAGTRAAPVLI